jgi:hypothetical protein
MMSFRSRCVLGLAACWLLCLSTGCAVPQPRGEGKYSFVTEPRTGAGYHLYLPKDYVQNNGRHPHYPIVKRWPLVMTFHGMEPYDNARRQEREWEKEADIYGYIVCAPRLDTCDSFMEYPLTKEHSYVLRDRENVIAIMDHVFQTTLADQRYVLSTSWSCGGYFAHYLPNRYPERFTCIATRLSNFSDKLLIEDTVPRYRDRMAVAVFIGDGDLPKCKSESQAAVAWYLARNFRVVRGKMIDDMGHRRIPQTAAAFFAEQIGLQPLYPFEASQTVSRVRMTEYYPPADLLARYGAPADATPAVASRQPAPTVRSDEDLRLASIDRRSGVDYVNLNAGRNYPFGATPLFDPKPESVSETSDRRARAAPEAGRSGDNTADRDGREAARGGRTASARRPASPLSGGESNKAKDAGRKRSTPPANTRTAARKPDRAERAASVATPLSSERAQRVNVKIIGSAVGTAPHYITYAIDLPRSLTGGADFLWQDNGTWIGDEATGSKLLETPGAHRITVLMVTKDNVEYRGMANVYVLERGTSASGGKASGAP